MLLTHDHSRTLALIVSTALNRINDSCHLLVLICKLVNAQLQLSNKGLEMESITIGWIFALRDSYKLFNLIHLLQ